jgi:hypothetical protein
LHQRRKQKAVLGPAADPSIMLEIEELSTTIEELEAELETVAETQSGAPPGGGMNLIQALIAGIQQEQTLIEWVPDEERPAKYRGLILLVGIGRPGEDPMSQSAGHAITYHVSLNRQEVGLEHCWLIASAGEQGSVPVAQTLQTVCQKRFGVETEILTVANPFNVQETYEVVQHIYRSLLPIVGLTEQEVIADFTGGVKPMSAGMILACGQHRPMQYYTGRKAGLASLPQLIRFTPWSAGDVMSID